MTATEILNYVEECGISESDFAYGEFGDQELFNNYSEELMRHKEAKSNFSRDTFKIYRINEMDSKSIWELEKEEFEAAGSPKSPLGEWKEVEKYGGEGQGETWYSIKHFIDHDVYIRTDGYYSSYNGTDFNDGYGSEVKPVQKTVTAYEG